jgi:hypothetical protein
MKHLKYFENAIEDKPQVGDYVLMKSQAGGDTEIYIDKTIGLITKFDSQGGVQSAGVHVKYPKNYYTGINDRLFNINQIVNFAPTKKELQIKLTSNKFNI